MNHLKLTTHHVMYKSAFLSFAGDTSLLQNDASTMDYVSDEQDDQPLSIRIGTACVAVIAVIWSGYLLWTLVAMAR